VKTIQRRQDREGHVDASESGSGPAPAGPERLPVEQFHGDEEVATILTDLVDVADIRVADARRRPRLSMEPLACLLVRRRPGDGLDRHRAVQLLVVRA